MFIVPMSGITPLDVISQNKKDAVAETSGDTASFTDVFKQALQNAQDTQKVSQEDSAKVALGQIDDLHTVEINTQKAKMAVEVLVTMKNTAMDAYNEVMRMTL